MTILEQFLMENGFSRKYDRDKLLESNESLDNAFEKGHLKQYEDWGDTYTECLF